MTSSAWVPTEPVDPRIRTVRGVLIAPHCSGECLRASAQPVTLITEWFWRCEVARSRAFQRRQVVGRRLSVGILGWIVLGLLAGAIAKAIMPGKDPGGIIITMLIGIVGAILGGFIGSAVFGTDLGSFFEIRTWLLAIVGALILLGIYRLVTGRRSHA